MQRFEPPPDSPEQRAKRDAERKHFIFAAVLILGAMLMLPLAGAAYVILVKMGVFEMPKL